MLYILPDLCTYKQKCTMFYIYIYLMSIYLVLFQFRYNTLSLVYPFPYAGNISSEFSCINPHGSEASLQLLFSFLFSRLSNPNSIMFSLVNIFKNIFSLSHYKRKIGLWIKCSKKITLMIASIFLSQASCVSISQSIEWGHWSIQSVLWIHFVWHSVDYS